MAVRKVFFRLEGHPGDTTETAYPGCFDVLEWGLGSPTLVLSPWQRGIGGGEGKPADQSEFWVMLRSSSASTGLSNARTSGKTFSKGTIIVVDDGREIVPRRQFQNIQIAQHRVTGTADVVSFSGRKEARGGSGNDYRNANHP